MAAFPGPQWAELAEYLALVLLDLYRHDQEKTV